MNELNYLMGLRDELTAALQRVRQDKNFDELTLEARQAVCSALGEEEDEQ